MKLQQASTTWGICLAIGLRLIFLLDPRSRWPIGKEVLESCRVCSSRAPSSSSARLSTETAPCGETQTMLKWGSRRATLDLPEDCITFTTGDILSVASQLHPSNTFCSAPLLSEDTGLDLPAPHPWTLQEGPCLKTGGFNSLDAHGE